MCSLLNCSESFTILLGCEHKREIHHKSHWQLPAIEKTLHTISDELKVFIGGAETLASASRTLRKMVWCKVKLNIIGHFLYVMTHGSEHICLSAMCTSASAGAQEVFYVSLFALREISVSWWEPRMGLEHRVAVYPVHQSFWVWGPCPWALHYVTTLSALGLELPTF